jgi:hypothetical protein
MLNGCKGSENYSASIFKAIDYVIISSMPDSTSRLSNIDSSFLTPQPLLDVGRDSLVNPANCLLYFLHLHLHMVSRPCCLVPYLLPVP